MADKFSPEEKTVGLGTSTSNSDAPPSYGNENIAYSHKELSIWTRMGVTGESFQRRTGGSNDDLLNHTLKPRHLHMIAIGGSIGA